MPEPDPELGVKIARKILRELVELDPPPYPEAVNRARRRFPPEVLARVRARLGSPYRHPHGELLGEIGQILKEHD